MKAKGRGEKERIEMEDIEKGECKKEKLEERGKTKMIKREEVHSSEGL